MNHPVIASANAENHFNDLLIEAENHRRRKRLKASTQKTSSFLVDLFQVLNGVFSKDQREAASDEMTTVKP